MVWGTEQTNPSSDAGGNAGAAPAMQNLLLHCCLSTVLNEKHPPGAMQEQVLHCPTLLLIALPLAVLARARDLKVCLARASRT